VPYVSSEKLTAVMKKTENHYELIGFEGGGHAFFNWNYENPDRRRFYVETIRETDRLFALLYWLKAIL
jgi:hypothetical protein